MGAPAQNSLYESRHLVYCVPGDIWRNLDFSGGGDDWGIWVFRGIVGGREGGSYSKKRLVFKIKYWVAFIIVVFVDKKISSFILTPFKIRSSFFFFDKFLKNGT